jgi:hypothetical protein
MEGHAGPRTSGERSGDFSGTLRSSSGLLSPICADIARALGRRVQEMPILRGSRAGLELNVEDNSQAASATGDSIKKRRGNTT